MSDSRKYILTIGGFDPCNGAGITSDVKTAEAIGAYALSVQTCVTIQNEAEIRKIYWHDLKQIKEQIDVLVDQYFFEYVKLSLTNGLRSALEIIEYIRKTTDAKIIWDPVMQSSSGYDFYSGVNGEVLKSILENIYLATPNWNEMKRWEEGKSPTASGSKFGRITNIYLKGGHNQDAIGVDYLFYNQGKIKKIASESISTNLKHGSGCVFATAIISYLALGKDIVEAGEAAKVYTFNFLESSTSVLGEHNIAKANLTGLNDLSGLGSDSKSVKSKTSTLKPTGYYHVFNRANGEEQIFKEPENYVYFISLLAYHIKPVADVLAYCLLPNHFHLIVKMKGESDIPEQFAKNLSQPFSNLFNAYTKGFNKMFDRNGSLFQRPFKKELIYSDDYLINSILYVHTNPEHHKLSADFINYPYSSYQTIIDDTDRLVNSKKCLELFGDIENYSLKHKEKQSKIELEFEK